MAEVTDADRERAADWIESVLDNWVGAFDHSNDEARDRVYVLTKLASAFAEERERARAPFRELVAFYDRHEYATLNVDDVRELLNEATA